MVGDPAQTIYSFAGANACYLRDFPAKFPDTTSVELVRNYRSTPEVISAANTLLAGSPSRGVELRAQRGPGPAVAFVGNADEVAEAQAVASRIVELREAGRPAGEIAVLFRINAQSESFEDALAGRGIPYVVRGGARFFDRPEVRQAVTLLRGTARSGEADDGMEDTVRATLSGMGWSPEAPATRGQTRDRWESLQALVDQAVDFARRDDADLGAFVDDLDRRASEQHAPVADGVTLATLHSAKGLEWDSVFVTGVQEGTMPFSYAESPTQVEEERRLLYVGLTRARVDLTVSWSRARNPGGRATRRPSRFLDGLVPQESREPERPTRRKVVHCRECGKPLTGKAQKVGRCADCPASYDEELFERLREWRKARAAEDSIPAFMVFTDATLQLIAEHKPRSEQALLRVNGVGQSKLETFGADVLSLVE